MQMLTASARSAAPAGLFALRPSLRLCFCVWSTRQGWQRPADFPAGAQAVVLAGAAAALAMAVAGCGSRPRRRPRPNSHLGDQRDRCRERVRQRAGPDRRPVRARVLDPEQPEHRPAHVRVEPERGQRGQRRPADRAERRGLRHVHEQDRVRVAGRGPQGDHRPERARAARQHA